MKASELKNKSKEELQEILKKKRHELLEFKFLIGQGRVKNNKAGRELKKDIARVYTHLKQI
ncbi:MAG: 50S ribosomal protein L29 [Candidatus Niyogibacteria bacterium CG10_big_fil_rev_8_21_14_0_10_42_19]|uniref:Large ribosomal subunit protein uL29 n=1 Tax=Candidatus Niyogibacteria bacterium CG10_big_fil_rev_8_21_14_0_10_42_19 TaxID=1974725 RepID=A0A2H0TFD1_9BACT|nr:MAG: 50S ribosomal protein L29 [Candidatus Niyogibacteria bacterium CG10_big_fil_rev_8_21_14_0_10_42_19]